MMSLENGVQIKDGTTATSSPLIMLGFVVITSAFCPTVSFDDDGMNGTHHIPYLASFDIISPAPMPDLFEERINQKAIFLKNKINEFKSLEKDWNGYDANPVPTAVVEAALLFLEKLLESKQNLDGWEVFPTARETIQFEKNIGDDYVEIEVYSGGRFAFYSEGRQNIEIESLNLMETLEKIPSVFG